MRTRLAHYRSLLRATFWFIPGVMIVLAVGLAAVALALD
jgi:uncharacterized membrane protein